MALRLYNTLTRRKEDFKPIQCGEVRMYTCGPTVYDHAHIGNFRAYVFQDLLRRYLEYRGFHVTHVMNITDVDDKTIRNSRERAIPLSDYTETYTKHFFEDLTSLNCLKAHTFCKATEHIEDMVDMVTTLMKKGHAYRGNDGSIYFDISTFKDYGKLGNLDLEGLRPGARVVQDEYDKESVSDFALWKAWNEEDGDVYWETHLGKGRPGWHIECSVMSTKYLGNPFDIHCGGIDLVFPHHENEIAQTEAATGKKFVNYWIHNEYLIVDGRKMSKSLGNFYTLRDLMARGFSPRAIRYLLMATHYRQRLNLTTEGLVGAENALRRLFDFLEHIGEADGRGNRGHVEELLSNVTMSFEEALNDDMNTSEALGALFHFVKEVNRLLVDNEISRGEAQKVISQVMAFDRILGILQREEDEIDDDVRTLIAQRDEARREKNWKLADQIRKTLSEKGIILEDRPGETRWKRK